jgi:uncharacterized protein (DUF58 family)
MQRFLTKRIALILLSILLLLIAWNRDINLLYAMFALVSSITILSHILPRLSLRGVDAERHIPSTAFEDEVMEVVLDVKNNHRRGRYMIEMIDHIPALAPGEQEPMVFIAALRGRGRRRFAFNLTCYKRGQYRLGPLRVRSAYPLGLSFFERRLHDTRPEMIVYPRVFEIAHLPFLSGSNMPLSGVEAVSKAGGTEEFFGTREYREGDSLRYIHWPSTARHSRLIVKEFELRASTEITILLDLHRHSDIGKGRETTLEYAVRIAASISRYALERAHAVQLISYGKSPWIVPYSRGISHLQRILNTLARVKADGHVPYPEAITRASNMMEEGGSAVLIFSRSDIMVKDVYYGLSLLRAKRIMPVGILINENSFVDGDVSGYKQSELMGWFTSQGMPVYHVRRGDDLKGVFS